MEEVNTTELRNFLLKHMKGKRRLPKILSDKELNVFLMRVKIMNTKQCSC